MNTEARASDKATSVNVTRLHRWTNKLITFRTTRPAGYDFVPGQYARLGLHNGGVLVWRAYSLTSAPDEEELEFYGIIVEGGQFTTMLDRLQVGDTMWLDRQVFGFMTPGRFPDGEDLWMLATGTGIGPFISILRDRQAWQRWRRLVLVHGVRRHDEFAYDAELKQMQAAHAGVQGQASLALLQLVSRDPPAERLHGRITTLLAQGELERAADLPLTVEHSRVMLCGNPAMIEETRKMLHERGMRPVRRMTPGQFVTENYW